MTGDPEGTADDGARVETVLWALVGGLRARGLHISLREIHRAQDVIAYLVVRFGRQPTDDELERHLRPIFCGMESELATFAEVFRQSLPTAAATERPTTQALAIRRRWIVGGSAVAAAVLLISVLLAPLIWPQVLTPVFNGSPQPSNVTPSSAVTTQYGPWAGLVLVVWIVVGPVVALVLRKRLRRRAGPHDPGDDLELHWATTHPLDDVTCQRMARQLRTRVRERGRVLDVSGTVEASLRAGLRLTPRFVDHKRTPEYLALIEQRSARDVLAEHHARIVDQVSSHGVSVRRLGIETRSQLLFHPVQGRRRLESLQPSSERERLLLFAPERTLHDPISGRSRPWLSRLDRWAQTTQIGPDVDQQRPSASMDRAVVDVRCFDPTWAPGADVASGAAAWTVPAVFEVGDELWVEPVAPAEREVTRALMLLATSLGPDGWYWLSGCALYPEISYDLTIALGRLLIGEDGQPVNRSVDVAVLAQLPWFRHAHMPDWLRSALLSTLSHGQLVELRACLDSILVSGLVDSAGPSHGLTVSEQRPSPQGRSGLPAGAAAGGQVDRVYLDASSLRRRHLAAHAPRQLVAAMRRQRQRFAVTARLSDAPSLRVRRAIAWSNALLVILAGLSSAALALQAFVSLRHLDGDVDRSYPVPYVWWSSQGNVVYVSVFTVFLSIFPAAVSVVFSLLLRRARGVLLGCTAALFWVVFVWGSTHPSYSDTPANERIDVAATAFLLGSRALTLAITVAALVLPPSSVVVPWARFQRLNRATFVVTAAIGIGGFWVYWVAATNRNQALRRAVELVFQSNVALIMAIFSLMAAGAVGLTSAYLAGARVIVVASAAVVIGYAVYYTANEKAAQSLLFGLPTLLFVGGFYRLLRRAGERPPLEFWETRWFEWRGPLALVLVTAAAIVSWSATTSAKATIWVTAVAVIACLLNLGGERLIGGLARLRHRYRPLGAVGLHLD